CDHASNLTYPRLNVNAALALAYQRAGASPAPVSTPTPFLGAPFAVGDLIQAEDFDNGGEGVAYHASTNTNPGGVFRTDQNVGIEATTDAGGGYDVGWTQGGDWLDYTLNAPAAGTYDFL